MHDAAQLVERLRRIFGIGRISLVDDSGDQQKVQVVINAGGPDGVEETIDGAVRVGEYGLASSPPIGAQAIVLYLAGRRSLGVVLGTVDRATRKKGLQAGEVALFNGVAGQSILLGADGKVSISADTLVDGELTAAKLHAQDGASGSFTSQDGKTITVVDGIITRIA